ncbi:Dna ligase iii [Phytophthora palmivora]|uniref:Dna ligase iii n=1 Tax=Phytophthora palmivora TaxID=4796 RepID=A0A2P4YVF0_9STRA|nr:Dna ligase iii [Phytophthora palmivora]
MSTSNKIGYKLTEGPASPILSTVFRLVGVLHWQPIETTDLLVFCGIPGSGKSSFHRGMVKRTMASHAAPITARRNNVLNQPWAEIHWDETGRKGCEKIIGYGNIRWAILDRCNNV